MRTLALRSAPLARQAAAAIFAGGMAILCPFPIHGQEPVAKPSQAVSQPGTYWSDDKILSTVNAVAMGPKLKPKSWPNGAPGPEGPKNSVSRTRKRGAV